MPFQPRFGASRNPRRRCVIRVCSVACLKRLRQLYRQFQGQTLRIEVHFFTSRKYLMPWGDTFPCPGLGKWNFFQNEIAPCKVIQGSIKSRIPGCGFRTPGAGFRILSLQIPDSKTQKIPDFSLWFAPNFCRSFSRNDFNGGFEGHVCESMFIYLYFHNNIW